MAIPVLISFPPPNPTMPMPPTPISRRALFFAITATCLMILAIFNIHYITKLISVIDGTPHFLASQGSPEQLQLMRSAGGHLSLRMVKSTSSQDAKLKDNDKSSISTTPKEPLIAKEDEKGKGVGNHSHSISLNVDCGGHSASTCADCPNGHGSAWCNGDCIWSSENNACMQQTKEEMSKQENKLEWKSTQKVIVPFENYPDEIHTRSRFISKLDPVDVRTLLTAANKTVPDLLMLPQGKVMPSSRRWSMKELELLEWDDSKLSQRTLFLITPTYHRPSQVADLTKTMQTIKLASIEHGLRVYWILVEDADTCSRRVRSIATRSGVLFAHVASKTPKGSGHKGWSQRNLGLDIVDKVGVEGVIYFADDDNTYDTLVFSEICFTRLVSLWNVGFSGNFGYERCEVDEDTGKIVRIHSGWVPAQRKKFGRRKFPMDMAGFAFSTAVLAEKKPRYRGDWPPGYLETKFLELIADSVEQLEPLAGHCLRILSWHVSTGRANHKPVSTDRKNFQLVAQLL